jgi:hypothetical protein
MAAFTQSDDLDLNSLSLDELLSINLSRTGLMDVPHFHAKGDWMVSYKYHRMEMKDILNGTESLSTSDVLGSYMVSPVAMTMNMHMIGFMYGVSEKLNLMGMLNHMDVSMDAVNRMSMPFTTGSNKFGDTKASALYKIAGDYNSQFFTTFGVSLPTGDINVRGDTPMGQNQRLPYPMQLGSGTVDPHLALTYIQLNDNASYGINVNSVMRFYDNANEYRLGNRYNLSAWYSRVLSSALTVFARADGKTWGDIQGADPELNPMMAPTADPDLRGGSSAAWGTGVNFSLGTGALDGVKISLQYTMPFYQDLDGPQLETDGQLDIGLILRR